MADEVEIVNVGGDGVASEVTLKLLIEAVEKMAKASGKDPASEAKKVADAHKKAVKDDIEVIEDHTDALEDNTNAFKRSTRAMGNLFTSAVGLAGQGFGMATTAAINFTSTLMDANSNLTDFANHIPIIGSMLGLITQPMDESVDSFRTLAKVGGDFGRSLEELRQMAVDSRMSLSDFSHLIERNSERLASFGGNVTTGARLLSSLSGSIDNNMLDRFGSLGLTFEELNDQLLLTQYLDRAGSRIRNQTQQEQLEATASLTKNMLTLSRLTGDDVETIQQRIAAETQLAGYQLERSRLEQTAPGMGQMADSLMGLFSTMGDGGAEAFRAAFIGRIPVDEAGRSFMLANQEIFDEMQRLSAGLRTGSVTFDQASESIARARVEAANRQIQQYGGLLEAQASGVDFGPIQGLISAVGGNINDLSAFLDPETQMIDLDRVIENIRGTFDSLEESIDPEITARQNLEQTTARFRNAITTNLINPLINLTGPAFESLATSLESLIGDGNSGDGSLTGFQVALQNIRTFIEGPFTESLNSFMEAFRDDPSQAIADLMSKVVDAVADFLLGPNTISRTRIIDTPVGPQTETYEEEIERQGGVVGSMIDSITDFWSGPNSEQLRDRIVDLFRGTTEIIGNEVRRALGGTLGTSVDQGEQDSLIERFRSGEELSREEQQDLIQSLRGSIDDLRVDQDRFGARLTRGINSIGDIASDAVNADTWINPEGYIESLIEGLSEEQQRSAEVRQESEAERQRLLEQLTSSLSGNNAFWGFEQRGQENAIEELRELNQRIQNLGGDAILIPTVNIDGEEVAGDNQYSQGTRGFENFGRGTLAMLHGEEAVVPRNTPHGEFLANMNDGTIDLEKIINDRVEAAITSTQRNNSFSLPSTTDLNQDNQNISPLEIDRPDQINLQSQFNELSDIINQEQFIQNELIKQSILDGINSIKFNNTGIDLTNEFDNLKSIINQAQFIQNALIEQSIIDGINSFEIDYAHIDLTNEFDNLKSIINQAQFIQNASIEQSIIDGINSVEIDYAHIDLSDEFNTLENIIKQAQFIQNALIEKSILNGINSFEIDYAHMDLTSEFDNLENIIKQAQFIQNALIEQSILNGINSVEIDYTHIDLTSEFDNLKSIINQAQFIQNALIEQSIIDGIDSVEVGYTHIDLTNEFDNLKSIINQAQFIQNALIEQSIIDGIDSLNFNNTGIDLSDEFNTLESIINQETFIQNALIEQSIIDGINSVEVENKALDLSDEFNTLESIINQAFLIQNSLVRQSILDGIDSVEIDNRLFDFSIPIKSINSVIDQETMLRNDLLRQSILSTLETLESSPTDFVSPFNGLDQFLDQAMMVRSENLTNQVIENLNSLGNDLDPLKLNEYSVSLNGVYTGLQNLSGISGFRETFDALNESLDPTDIIEYRKNIEMLTEVIEDLRDELSQDSISNSVRNGIQEVSIKNEGLNQLNSTLVESMKKLDTYMEDIKELLKDSVEFERRISRNTYRAGSDISRTPSAR